jgi:hypothetical protein
MAVNDQVPNTLSEKLLNEEVRKMISNIENLNRMWKTMDACYQRPEKYISEVLQSVTNSGNTRCQTARLSKNSTPC